MKTNEVAKVLGISRQRVHVLIKGGQLKAHQNDCGCWVVQPSDLTLYQTVTKPSLDKLDAKYVETKERILSGKQSQTV